MRVLRGDRRWKELLLSVSTLVVWMMPHLWESRLKGRMSELKVKVDRLTVSSDGMVVVGGPSVGSHYPFFCICRSTASTGLFVGFYRLKMILSMIQE